MHYQGSCHCGTIAFEAEGQINSVIDCNCSYCRRKGALLWIVPAEQFRLKTPADRSRVYRFGKRTIDYHFCPDCGVHAYAEGNDPSGKSTIAINVRCLDDVDLDTLKIDRFDGRAL